MNAEIIEDLITGVSEMGISNSEAVKILIAQLSRHERESISELCALLDVYDSANFERRMEPIQPPITCSRREEIKEQELYKFMDAEALLDLPLDEVI